MNRFNIVNRTRTSSGCVVVANITPKKVATRKDGCFDPFSNTVKYAGRSGNKTIRVLDVGRGSIREYVANLVACQTFLDTVYTLVQQDKHRLAAAKVMDFLDDALLDGNISMCNLGLALLNVEPLKNKPTVLLAFLSVTVGCDSKKLPARAIAFDKIRNAIVQEIGEVRTADVVDRFK